MGVIFMNEKIYLHTINNGFSDYYKPKRQKEILESILRDKAVLSRRKQGGRFVTPSNFAGLDYISLTDYEKRFVCNKEQDYYNSYYGYVRHGLSISFPHEKLEVIEPEIISICSNNKYGYQMMCDLGLSEHQRYTDLPDEVQIKDSIDVNKMNGILFPTQNFMYSRAFTSKRKMIELMKKELEDIHNLLDKYNHNVGIYDVDTLEEINDSNILTLSSHK